VNGSIARTVGYLSRLSLRRQRSGALWLAALLVVVGGASMAATAAARRTESAYPKYLSSSNASQLQLFVYHQEEGAEYGSPQLAAGLATLPHVEHVATSPVAFLSPQEPPGVPAPNPIVDGEVEFLGSTGGANYAVDRPAVEEGRMPDPRSTDQVVASASAAALLGWHLGEQVVLDGYALKDVEASGSFPPPAAKLILKVTVTLVGIVEFASQVAHDDVDRYPTYVLLPPALSRKVVATEGFANYALTLDGGDRSVSKVENEITGLLPPFTIYAYHVTSVVEGQVQRAIRPEAIALFVFGLIAAAAALAIGVQGIRRIVWAVRDELVVARALGADQPSLLATAGLGPAVAIIVGALGAAAVAFVASPIAPIGAVRAIDPSPGVDADWTVLLGTIALLVVALGAFTAQVVYVEVGRALRGTRERAPHRSVVADLAARSGAPVTMVAGLRFSLERGSARTAAPVRSALAASVVAVVVAVTTVTFASSLGTLDSTPALYGWNWSVAILSPSGTDIPPIAGTLLSRDHDVAAWTGLSFANATMNNQTVPIILGSTHAPVGPPLLAGHELDSPGQVVLGSQTLAELHAKLGGTITVSYGSVKDYPIYISKRPLRVVGIATMPAVGASGNLHTSMGVGGELATGIEPPAFARALRSPDPNLDGPNTEIVRFVPGTSPSSDLRGLDRIARITTKVMQADPSGAGDTYVVVGPQRPAEIVIYQSTGATPVALALALGAGATAALGLALASSVRRRRRDLALLKTLGFARRQLAGAIAWQASTVAIVGVVLGVPIGVALGRWLWTIFARQIGAVPEATVPVAQLVLIVGVAIVLANGIAAIPGKVAARTPAALVLRSE
jgi:hypothetical protein